MTTTFDTPHVVAALRVLLAERLAAETTALAAQREQLREALNKARRGRKDNKR
jgi:hypothetical protein